MKNFNLIKLLSIMLILLITKSTYAQLPDGFDLKKAYQDAQNKGISSTDIEGYVQYLHNDFLSHKNNSNHSHSFPVQDLGTIYLGGSNPSAYRTSGSGSNTTQNAYCPNAGFEQLNFANWTGGYGTVVTGATTAGFPSYTQTSPTIANSAGNNVGLTNTINYHTIMTTPATNSVYPNCVGYDSIACKVVGTQTVSEIPVVNPLGGPASVRLNGAVANYRASKINYNMALNPNNKSFSVSYALVLYSGGHNPYEQPYFSVKVTDQNGNPVPGCSVYTVTINSAMTNTASTFYDPTWTTSAIGFDVYYRKWQTFAFDFSNYPAVTSVNVEFYVGGCSQGGHWGYAYVDAECSTGGAVASFCAGSNTSVLTAPPGYSTYQWVGPSGAVTVPNGGNTATATISPVTAGQVFTCNVTAPNGCLSSFQTTVSITTVSITAVGSTPSCQGGNSGTTNVTATGSSSGYSYQWFNSSGTPVGSSQTATGLSPGVYSITVTSPMCGSATSTVAVNISPPSYYGLSAPYCGSVAWITKPGGSGYKWYTASPLALIAGATSSSLTINSPVNGSQYYLTYTTASGCKDSIKYTLAQTPGGSIYVSNVKSICPGNSNSYAVINLQTTAPPAYSYSVTGPSGYSSTLTNTTSIKDSVVGLSIGTYSVIAFDGQCLYNTTFTVAPFTYTYTLTPQSSTVCTTGTTSLTVNFGNNTSASCGLDPSVCLTGSPTNLFSGPFTQNGTTTYPTPYGNWYTYERSQYLIRASDLNTAGINAGKISSLSFNVLNLNTSITTYPNFYIKMGCTGLASLPDVTNIGAQPFIAGLQTVYSNPNQPITTGWVTHNFSQAYVWDGVSNIIIEVCFGMNTSSNYSQNVSIELKQLPYVASLFHAEDPNPVCSGSQSADNSYGPMASGQYMVPNMKLGYCGGQNPSAFTYTWTPSTGLSSTTSYSTIANPSVTTIYSVQVNPIGQTNCMQAQTATLVVINPTTPTITPVSALCTNASSFSLTALPTGGTWSLTPATSTVGVFTPSLASVGNNTVTYTYGGVGCLQSTTAIVPVEKYVPSTITGNISPLCTTNPTVNLSTSLTTSTLGVGVWAGNGVTGTTFNPAIAGAGTHTITYSTNSLPTTTLCPSTSSITISVSSLTQPTITPAGPYCDDFAIQSMTVSPSVASGATWSSTTSPTAISTSGQFNPAIASLGNSSITYSVVNGPCTASTSIVVNVIHFIPATITGTVGPYCIYNPLVSLQATAQYTGGVWSGSGVTGSDFTPALAGAGTNTVTYKTDPTPSGLCPDSAKLSILVNAKPQANALSNVLQGCNPLIVNLYSSTVNIGNANWNFGDGSPLGNGLAISHTYSVPGIYTASISYTDAIGCVNDSAVANSFTVFANPIASFEPSLIQTTVVDGQIDFINHSTILNNNTYSWDIGGIATSAQTNTSYLFTNSGNYVITLTATSADNCVDDTSIVVIINPDVVLYVPNAFTPGDGNGLNDVFQIFLPPTGVDYATFSLQIFDRWGEMIYSTNDVTKYWNGAKNNVGSLLKQDTYVWKISFLDQKKKEYNKIGHVTILSKQ
jgi:gliding motility-associated-like protein